MTIALDDVIREAGGVLPFQHTTQGVEAFSGKDYLHALIAVKTILEQNQKSAEDLISTSCLGPWNMISLGDPFLGRKASGLRKIQELDPAVTQAVELISSQGRVLSTCADLYNPKVQGPVYAVGEHEFFVPNDASRRQPFPYILSKH